MASDPQTHVGVPDSRNHCHLIDPTRSINVSYQRAFCLQTSYPDCEVYKNSGQGPLPDAFLDDEDVDKGFGLSRFSFRRASQKPPKSTSSTLAAGALTASAVSSQSTPEILPIKSADSEATDRGAYESVADQVPSIATTTSSSAWSTPSGEGEMDMPSVRDSDEDFAALHNTAASRYQEVGGKQRGRFWWFLLLFIALVILSVAAYGLRQNFSRLQVESAKKQKEAYDISLATAVRDMEQAADQWSTAANQMEIAARTKTAVVIATVESYMKATELQATSDVLAALSAAQTATSAMTVCQDINSVGIEIVSGPELTPPLGTVLGLGAAPVTPQATWIVKNSGSCIWSQIQMLSILDNSVLQPVVLRNDVPVDFGLTNFSNMIAPGEQVKIALQFDLANARNVAGEWVLFINGLTLKDQPHFLLQANNWVSRVVLQYTPTPATKPKATKPGGAPGSRNTPTPGAPPGRTPTP
jgi:hypothetical protein